MNASTYLQHIQEQQARHDRVLAAAGFDAAVTFSGTPLLHFLDDNYYPFRVNPLFKAWVPLTDVPESFIIYVPGKRPTLVYFQPEDYWHLPPADPSGEWTTSFDIKIVRNRDDAAQFMPKGRVVFLGEMQARFGEWGFAATNPDTVLNPLHYARAWKTDYEIECMEQATRMGVRGHRAAAAAFARGAAELDIHLAYCSACRCIENDLPYTNIVALNQHAAVLHYTHYDTVAPDPLYSFLIDAGGSHNGYASDITRTYAHAPGLFADLIEAVDSTQRALCESLRPGIAYPTMHSDANYRLSAILADAGIIKCNADDAVSTGLANKFFPHGLGHYIGLQVHDVGGFMADADGTHVDPPAAAPSLRLTRKIDAGQIMTVEPGIYFIPTLLEPLRGQDLGKQVNWRLVDELYPYGGIRIEDNVLVTANGARNLTREEEARAG